MPATAGRAGGLSVRSLVQERSPRPDTGRLQWRN